MSSVSEARTLLAASMWNWKSLIKDFASMSDGSPKYATPTGGVSRGKVLLDAKAGVKILIQRVWVMLGVKVDEAKLLVVPKRSNHTWDQTLGDLEECTLAIGRVAKPSPKPPPNVVG
ncbi:hypothetical protein CYMTET_28258 [Cymbomonas tetramitiformis]|uniref:Uncharacterized protein n=1 Tax=Cymbomonas tetramitiformis TaxID=36881 RepID=A0AAE0FN69_9CHLO|nr:hypothetical protein CYMTET_28258 [Cymbomonas tetramitiformis]